MKCAAANTKVRRFRQRSFHQECCPVDGFLSLSRRKQGFESLGSASDFKGLVFGWPPVSRLYPVQLPRKVQCLITIDFREP